MNADIYQPLNVLSVFKSVHSEKLPYLIRHYNRDHKGKGEHFHYVVEVGGDRYFRLLFDTNTFTWRLIQDVKMGESVGFSEVSGN